MAKITEHEDRRGAIVDNPPTDEVLKVRWGDVIAGMRANDCKQ
jgi:hypothetical protein